ncbi:MAG: TatD family hydrolase, partial [Succinivibrio sp.]|nr:TatD family hydrolase [Succinivibrio sp.]
MFIDAHLHVGMFDNVQELLKCASKYQIFPIAVATTLTESSKLLKTLESLNLKLPVFVGIHPWYITDEKFDENLMENLLKDSMVVGIGECGLDGKIATPLDTQL